MDKILAELWPELFTTSDPTTTQHTTTQDQLLTNLPPDRRHPFSEQSATPWDIFHGNSSPTQDSFDMSPSYPDDTPGYSTTQVSTSSPSSSSGIQATTNFRFVNGPKRMKQDVCDICGKKNSNLRRHKKSKACRPPDLPDPKSFYCDHPGCSKGSHPYTRAEYLRRHQEKHYGCSLCMYSLPH